MSIGDLGPHPGISLKQVNSETIRRNETQLIRLSDKYTAYTNNLEASAEAFREGLAAIRRLPEVGQDHRGTHRRQANTMLVRAWIPSKHLSLSQAAELLRAEPAGVKIHTLGARHLNSE